MTAERQLDGLSFTLAMTSAPATNTSARNYELRRPSLLPGWLVQQKAIYKAGNVSAPQNVAGF